MQTINNIKIKSKHVRDSFDGRHGGERENVAKKGAKSFRSIQFYLVVGTHLHLWVFPRHRRFRISAMCDDDDEMSANQFVNDQEITINSIMPKHSPFTIEKLSKICIR